MSDAIQPVQDQKRGPVLTVLIVVVGVIAIVGGIAKMYRGVSKLTAASESPEAMKVIEQSDAAVAEGNRLFNDAWPNFQTLMSDVDTVGVAAIRKDKASLARDTADKFTASAAKIREGQTKIEEAVALGVSDELKTYIKLKGKAYALTADVYEKNAEIVRVVLDESLPTNVEALPKILDVGATRDELHTQAEAAHAEAEAITKK